MVTSNAQATHLPRLYPPHIIARVHLTHDHCPFIQVDTMRGLKPDAKFEAACQLAALSVVVAKGMGRDQGMTDLQVEEAIAFMRTQIAAAGATDVTEEVNAAIAARESEAGRG